jgi:hypothetical protein
MTVAHLDLLGDPPSSVAAAVAVTTLPANPEAIALLRVSVMLTNRLR